MQLIEFGLRTKILKVIEVEFLLSLLTLFQWLCLEIFLFGWVFSFKTKIWSLVRQTFQKFMFFFGETI